MKRKHNRKVITASMAIGAFIFGVVCTLLVGAATAEKKMGFDLDRVELELKTAFNEALALFKDEVGTDEITVSKSEVWDFVELGYWAGVYSHTVNMAQIIAYYDFHLLDPKERGNSLVAYSDKFISEQCERQTNRLAVVMRRKFENNSTEFKTTFGELQELLGFRADAENPNVVCPFEDAGLELYDTESETLEEESN